MSLASRLASLLRTASRSPAVRRGARALGRAAVRAVQDRRHDTVRGVQSSDPSRQSAPRPAEGDTSGRQRDHALADRRGSTPPALVYAPRQDERPDPGEVVWAWVPYEEDISQGKDRPVLVVAEEGAEVGGEDGAGTVLIALMLTSRDRTESGAVATDEHGATWVDIGSGEWDRQGRPSEVRADRLLRLAPDAVRREGGRLDRERYDQVASAVQELHGW
ncbi:MAG TPA: type II toxin-antitoxin system PemK/MazF family toxin [Brachybacterium sp.]